jgi:hypothetical protein
LKDVCPEKARLLSVRAATANRYAEAVGELHAAVANRTGQFSELYRVAETARIQAELARLDYEGHVAEHDC